MMGIHFNYKVPKMGNDEHTMETYTFPIMEIDSQSHQWVFRLGIDEFPFFFPSVGFRFFFLWMEWDQIQIKFSAVREWQPQQIPPVPNVSWDLHPTTVDIFLALQTSQLHFTI